MGAVKTIHSRRRSAALLFSVGAFGVASMMSMSAASAQDGAACKVIDIYPDETPDTYNVAPRKCGQKSSLFGMLTDSIAKQKVKVNETPVVAQPCSEAQRQAALANVVLGRMTPDQFFADKLCFPINVRPDTRSLVVQVESEAGGKPWMTESTTPASDKWEMALVDLRRRATTEGALGDKGKNDAKGGQQGRPVTAACKDVGDEQWDWCTAYVRGLKAAGLWDSAAEKPTEDGIAKPADWVDARTHVSLRGSDTYVLFFEGASPIAPLPQLDEDDKIVTVVLAENQIKELRVITCDGANPVRVGGTAQSGVVREAAFGLDSKVATAVAEKCSADGGMVAVLQLDGDTTSKDIKVPTLALNRFTLGLGLLFDFGQEVEYRAASVKGENTPLIVEDKRMVGISTPVPFITFRPVPVDMKRSRRASEMWGVSLGVSLVDPLEHLYLGGLFEPLPGFGLLLGAHAQKVPSLAGGYEPGDRFAGGEVPVDKRWKTEGISFFTGLSLDASLFSKFLEAVQ